MMTELTNRARKLKEGEGSFDGLIIDWARKARLEAWVRSQTLQEQDAKDLKQDILIDIFNRFEEFDDERGAFETWAFNRSRAITRSYRRSRTLEKIPVTKKGFKDRPTVRGIVIGFQDLSEEIQMEEIEEDNTYLTDLATVILQMDMNKKNRLTTFKTLRLLDEKSANKERRKMARKEIAEELNISKGKVNSNINRLRKAHELLEEARELI